MDKERYQAIKNRGLQLGDNFGLEHLAEDFVQEAALQFAEGRSATIGQVFVDYLRSEFGRLDPKTKKPSSKMESRLAEHLNYVEFVDDLQNRGTPVHYSEIRHIQNILQGAERAIFTFLCHGFSLAEIGDAFGVSESRIGQHMMAIKKKVRESGEF